MASKGHRPKADSQAVTRAQARRRRWRLRRRLERSNRRWRASSASTIEVRGERMGTASWGDHDGRVVAEAVRVMWPYKAVVWAKFQPFFKPLSLSLHAPYF
jgi:hypothetical protein